MELLSGHEKIITKSGISLNAGTLNRGFTVFSNQQLGTTVYMGVRVVNFATSKNLTMFPH
jgi:hypothetical protein